MNRHFVVLGLFVSACFQPGGGAADETDGTSSNGSTSATTTATSTMTTAPTTTTGTATTAPTTTAPTTTAPTTTSSGSDSTTDSDSTADTGSDSTTGSAACGTGICAPAVPEGWAGPVVMQVADGEATLSDCPAAFPTPVDDLLMGLSVDPTTCGCTCGAVTGVTCPPSATLSERDNCFQQTLFPETLAVGTACVRVNAALDWPAFSVLAAPNLNAASCLATPSETIPPPVWANQLRTCEGASGDACEDAGQCVDADGDFADVCIFQEGDLDCPAGYDEKLLGHDGVNDTRDCEDTCVCTDPEAACAGTVSFYSEGDDVGAPFCAGAVQATRTVGQCANSPSISNPSAEFVSAGFVSQGCTASSPSETGAITPTDSTTVCCIAGG